MSILVVFLVVLLLFLLYHYKARKSSNPNAPPSPPRLPFIGNLHQIDPSSTHLSLFNLSNKYGPLMSLKLGSISALVVSSARMAEEVMKNKDLDFCSRPRKYALHKFSYHGLDIITAPYNQQWREMRKISVVHLLSAKRIQQFCPILKDETSRMMEKIAKKSQTVTDLSDSLKALAITFICRIAFGKRSDDESQERKEIENLFSKGAELILEGVFFSDWFPSIAWLDKLNPASSQLDRLFLIFDTFVEDLIQEHLDPNRPESMDGDIIDIMLNLQQSKSATSFDFTMDHVKAMIMDLLFAGVETSSKSITLAMAALVTNPKVMKKLQAEMRGKMGDKELVEENDIESFPYLKATVKEVMRMYPAAPIVLPRETMQKCNLDGYEIEPKTYVIVSAMAIGRDPEVWESPDEFQPERFMNSSIDLKGQDFGLIPFGSGRRSCPAYSLAHLVVHLVLANLMHSFDWKLAPGTKVEDIDIQSFYNRDVALKLVATSLK